MTAATLHQNPLASLRLGFPHRRSVGAGGYRLPQRLVDGSRQYDGHLGANLCAVRGSRLEAGAPERL